MDQEKHELTTVCLYSLDEYLKKLESNDARAKALKIMEILEKGEELPEQYFSTLITAVNYYQNNCGRFYYPIIKQIKKTYN